MLRTWLLLTNLDEKQWKAALPSTPKPELSYKYLVFNRVHSRLQLDSFAGEREYNFKNF